MNVDLLGKVGGLSGSGIITAAPVKRCKWWNLPHSHSLWQTAQKPHGADILHKRVKRTFDLLDNLRLARGKTLDDCSRITAHRCQVMVEA